VSFKHKKKRWKNLVFTGILKATEEKSRNGAGSKCRDLNQSCGSGFSISSNSGSGFEYGYGSGYNPNPGFWRPRTGKIFDQKFYLCPSYKRRLQSSKMNIQHFKKFN
jgi:hypothetical protein